MHHIESHPPQSPFLWKGEDKQLASSAAQRLFTPFGTKGVGAQRRGDATRIAAVLALALITASASAAVGPNIRAVQPDHLDDYWVLANYSTLTADVPNSGTNLSKPTCTAVTYMIGSDGVTRDIVVRRTIPAGDLKSAAASLVKNMRYAAGAKNAAREPVFTYIIVPFNLPADKSARKKTTDACTLTDFPQAYR